MSAPLAWSQATAPDAATLAKYDTNKNGRLDASEVAAMDAAQKSTVTPATTNGNGTETNSDAVMLTPFEVVSDNKGYYAANTMSGTRFNSKLEDLASSITVVTKEQMQDFAMLDINDLFLYTAGTEGSGTYTALNVDRNGSVSDDVQLNPTQANRVRGIASANVSLGNIETMGRVPIDPLNIDGVEVSRGPNANVFGLGNPSGTVNQVLATANLRRNRSSATFRVDSYEGFRTTLDMNRVLLPGKLAIRASGGFQRDEFIRKPSGVDTVRYNGMVKYSPFKSTTISATYSYYRMHGNRPNFIPPRDSISYWIASGRPTWDPVAQIIHVNNNTIGAGGVGTTTPLTTATGVPDYFTNTFTGSTRSFAYVDQNGLGYWTAPVGTLSTSPLNATLGTATSGTTRLMSTTSAAGVALGRFTSQPLFTTTPTVNDKSLYDWSDVNIAAINRVMDKTETTNFQIDQFFFNTERQQLVGQVTVMREDSERYLRNLIGTANDNGQSGQLFVDINERNLDGTVNQYFLRPFIGTDQPRSELQPAKWDTYRAQLAYKLDLTQEKNALKWLGSHQISGYGEYKYRLNRRYSFRDAMVDSKAWIPAGVSRGNQGAVTGGPAAAPLLTRSYFRYYVGDTGGSNIDYAPTELAYGSYNYHWGTSANPISEGTALGQVAVTDATGAGNNVKTILKTMGGVIQSHFLNDSLVTTFGLRQDEQYVKSGSTPQRLNADGMSFDYASLNSWRLGDYTFNSGKTKTAGAVARPFRDLTFVKNMANENSGAPRVLGGALRGLFLTLNKSDSFIPQNPRSNLYFEALPNSTGVGKDYGFGVNMFDGKLVLRVNRWETKQLNNRGGDASTIAQRVLRIDIASTAAFLLHTQAPLWIAAEPAFAGATQDAINQEAGRRMGIPWDVQTEYINAFNAGTIASTNDITAKGTEIELNFNPTKFWTVSASVTDTKSVNTNVSKDINKWIAERMPVWTSIVDTRFAADPNPAQRLWWTHVGYGGSQTAAQNYTSFVETPFSVTKQLEGKSNPQIRRYNARVSSRYSLAGLTENRHLRPFSVGGAVRWEDKAAIGYYGKQTLPATITELDASRPIYDDANYYYDAFVTYRTKLWANKINAEFQLNVRNLTEGGHLQPIGAFPDGTPHTYRIVDPRQFILSASFDL
ncbi:MAG TPA: TonB-dependent receptor plug domain-containing protein [Opitutaceae bacterium]|nr:TonB-dependent receptor plug domain-containing protein [Opitutaceae bacterium]